MTTPDVTRLHYQLTLGAEAAVRVAAHIGDVHDLAYLRHVGEVEKVSGGDGGHGVETVGDPRARALWERLCAVAVHLDTLRTLERLVGNYLAAGPSPEETRGSFISVAEFVKAKRHQRDRPDTPARIERQPDYPGGERR